MAMIERSRFEAQRQAIRLARAYHKETGRTTRVFFQGLKEGYAFFIDWEDRAGRWHIEDWVNVKEELQTDRNWRLKDRPFEIIITFRSSSRKRSGQEP